MPYFPHRRMRVSHEDIEATRRVLAALYWHGRQVGGARMLSLSDAVDNDDFVLFKAGGKGIIVVTQDDLLAPTLDPRRAHRRTLLLQAALLAEEVRRLKWLAADDRTREGPLASAIGKLAETWSEIDALDAEHAAGEE